MERKAQSTTSKVEKEKTRRSKAKQCKVGLSKTRRGPGKQSKPSNFFLGVLLRDSAPAGPSHATKNRMFVLQLACRIDFQNRCFENVF